MVCIPLATVLQSNLFYSDVQRQSFDDGQFIPELSDVSSLSLSSKCNVISEKGKLVYLENNMPIDLVFLWQFSLKMKVSTLNSISTAGRFLRE